MLFRSVTVKKHLQAVFTLYIVYSSSVRVALVNVISTKRWRKDDYCNILIYFDFQVHDSITRNVCWYMGYKKIFLPKFLPLLDLQFRINFISSNGYHFSHFHLLYKDVHPIIFTFFFSELKNNVMYWMWIDNAEEVMIKLYYGGLYGVYIMCPVQILVYSFMYMGRLCIPAAVLFLLVL